MSVSDVLGEEAGGLFVYGAVKCYLEPVLHKVAWACPNT